MCSHQSIKTVTAVLILGFTVFVSTSASCKPLDRVVAKVNSEIITLSAVQERVVILMDKMRGVEGAVIPGKREMMEEALNMMVNEKLQIQEGKKLGFKVDEESVLKALDDIKAKNNLTDEQLEFMLAREGGSLEAYKRHIGNQIMVSKVMSFHTKSSVKVSQKDIQKYYEGNKKEFWVPPKIHVRHILFIIDDTLTRPQKRLKEIKAREVLKQIAAGEDFEKLAKKYSEDISASSGGDIGIVEMGKMVPEFEKALFELKDGEVGGIVQTQYGLHIIKNVKTISGYTRPLDEVKQQIEMRVGFEKRKKIYDDWVGDLKKTAFLEISLFEDQPDPKGNLNGKKKPAALSLKKKAQNKKVEEGFFGEEESGDVNLSADLSGKKTIKKNGKAIKGFTDLEKRLKYYKKLRDAKKISEREYQKKKTELLNRL